MILLETNVIFETVKAPVDANVQRWMDAQETSQLYLCAPVIAELRFGARATGSRQKAV